jgi:hypothetical protein
MSHFGTCGSHRVIVGIALGIAVAACAPEPESWAEHREALEARGSEDQRMIRELTQHFGDTAYAARLDAMFVENAHWLDSLVRVHGWPARATVGDSAGTAAFLIAQHADKARQAQRSLFHALQRSDDSKADTATDEGRARLRDLAFLEDRLLKGEGRPQMYGTQVDYDSAGTAVAPVVVEPEQLESRRRRMALPPMTEYLESMRALNAQLRRQAGREASPAK